MIASIISDLVDRLTLDGYTFEFGEGERYFQNLLADEEVFPAIYLDHPIKVDFEFSVSGYIGEKYDVTLLILFKSDLDWTPNQHDELAIIPAINTARKFITMCQNSSLVNGITSASGYSFKNIYDANVSGITLKLTIEPNINESICI